MIPDNELFFTRTSAGAESLASVTVDGGNSGNSASTTCAKVLDFGAAGNAVGSHDLVYCTFMRGGTITSGGTATVATMFETSADSSSWTELATQKDTGVTSFDRMVKPRLKILDGLKRYVRATVTVTVPANVSVTSALFDVCMMREQ